MGSAFEPQDILKEMLDISRKDVDRREGSVIFTTLAPTAYMIAKQNYLLAAILNELYADTAEEEWLDRELENFSVYREQATFSLRKVLIKDGDGNPFDIAVGSRFAINDITLKLTEKIDVGEYKAEVEQAGIIGNIYQGEILPIDNINGLGSAELVAEPLIPARDAETDEEYLERFHRLRRGLPYGGNIADYENKILAIEGVGAVKIFTAKTMGPGNVGIVIGDEQQKTATGELIDKVIDLVGEDGDGIAPIGHTPQVTTSKDLTVNVAVPIKLDEGVSLELIAPIVKQTVTDFINNIDFKDKTVFLARLASEILNCNENIVDYGNITMNGNASNLTLEKTFDNWQIPVIGEITVSEVV